MQAKIATKLLTNPRKTHENPRKSKKKCSDSKNSDRIAFSGSDLVGNKWKIKNLRRKIIFSSFADAQEWSILKKCRFFFENFPIRKIVTESHSAGPIYPETSEKSKNLRRKIIFSSFADAQESSMLKNAGILGKQNTTLFRKMRWFWICNYFRPRAIF